MPSSPKSKLSAVRIGQIGQSKVQEWAAQADITANPSFHDERGWDVCLQLPSSEFDAQKHFWDRAPPEISCMVQVKTTTTDKQSEPISLSNWQRMVMDPWPWFVVAIHLGPHALVTRAYIVHIDKEWCTRVLKRLRQLAKKGVFDLNKHTMDVTWDESQRIKNLHGSELASKIREYVKPTAHIYVVEKINWYEAVGYENKQSTVNFRLATQNSETFWVEMADLGVGLRSTFPGEWNARISDVRFGIRAMTSEFGRELGEMELYPQPQGSAMLEIFGTDPELSVSFECEVYRAAASFPFIPSEYDKIRFKHKLLECIFSRIGSGNLGSHFTMNLPPEVPITLDEIFFLVKLIKLFRSGIKEPLQIKINNCLIENQVPINPAELNSAVGSLEWFDALESAATICARFGINKSESISPVSVYRQRVDAQTIATILRAESEIGESRCPYKRKIPLGTMCAIVIVNKFQMEEHRLVSVSAFYGPVTSSEEHPELGCRVTIAQSRTIMDRYVINNKKRNGFNFEHATKKLIQRLKSLGCEEIGILRQVP